MSPSLSLHIYFFPLISPCLWFHTLAFFFLRSFFFYFLNSFSLYFLPLSFTTWTAPVSPIIRKLLTTSQRNVALKSPLFIGRSRRWGDNCIRFRAPPFSKPPLLASAHDSLLLTIMYSEEFTAHKFFCMDLFLLSFFFSFIPPAHPISPSKISVRCVFFPAYLSFLLLLLLRVFVARAQTIKI